MNRNALKIMIAIISAIILSTNSVYAINYTSIEFLPQDARSTTVAFDNIGRLYVGSIDVINIYEQDVAGNWTLTGTITEDLSNN